MWKPAIVVFLVLFASNCHGFNFVYPQKRALTYSFGDEMLVEVNSLTSIDTHLPISYYTLPYCEPPGGIKKSKMNLGQLLLGDQVLNSPYRCHMNVNETVFLCVQAPLTAEDVKLLKTRTRSQYQVNMILGSLPVKGLMGYYTMIGFPIGYTEPRYIHDYIYNHLSFRVSIREHEGIEIIGFEVVPCSVKHDPNGMSNLRMYENIQPIQCPWGAEKPQIIQENESVAFTYGVEFVKSDIVWPYQSNSTIRWLSITNSLITISILAVILVVIYWRTIRRELKRFEKLDVEPQGLMSKEISGWKLLVGEVFREPGCAMLLCVMVGGGVQILATVSATILLVVVGFTSFVSRGTLLATMITLYVLFGVVGGYISVRLWRTIKGTSEGWKSVSWSVACCFPGLVFVVLTFSNTLLYNTESTKTIPASLFLILLSLWFCILVPLTLIGGLIGSKAEPIHYPLHTNRSPREIPARKFRSWALVLGVGYIPFGTFYIELIHILSDIRFGRLYDAYGFLLIFLVLLVVECSTTSVILTYSRLNAEDWRWWWKAFFASGSTGIHVFLYMVKNLIFDMEGSREPASDVLCLGYSLIVAVAVMLATGAIGFLVSSYFVHYLFSSYKIT